MGGFGSITGTKEFKLSKDGEHKLRFFGECGFGGWDDGVKEQDGLPAQNDVVRYAGELEYTNGSKLTLRGGIYGGAGWRFNGDQALVSYLEGEYRLSNSISAYGAAYLGNKDTFNAKLQAGLRISFDFTGDFRTKK